MKRNRNDSVKPGCGIDGSGGENFTKNRQDPWSPPKMGGEDINPKGAGKYTSDDSGLRNKLPDEATSNSRDIFDNVEKNSGEGKPAAIRYGVD
jgi:hypothetical protein